MAVDHASAAAAVTAGYREVAIDRGATFAGPERFYHSFQKPSIGVAGSGGLIRADGYGSSAGAAQTMALSALNAQRKLRYAAGSANTGKNIHGTALTDDLH